jgi:hypothetical protein
VKNIFTNVKQKILVSKLFFKFVETKTKTKMKNQFDLLKNGMNAVRSIQFERKYAMKNGNKLTKKNWHKVVAHSTRPCTNVRGVAVIDNEIAVNGQYFEKWVLRYEPKDEFSPAGYIFREVNHNGGISGRHSTPKEAVWSAMKHYIQVWLEE